MHICLTLNYLTWITLHVTLLYVLHCSTSYITLHGLHYMLHYLNGLPYLPHYHVTLQYTLHYLTWNTLHVTLHYMLHYMQHYTIYRTYYMWHRL